MKMPQNQETRDIEDDRLKAWYVDLWGQRKPMNENSGYCDSKESAYLYDIEDRSLTIHEEVKLGNLFLDVTDETLLQLRKLWRKILTLEEDLEINIELLTEKLQNYPKGIVDPIAQQIVADLLNKNEPSLIIRSMKESVIALISRPNRITDQSRARELYKWKKDEKNTRKGVYDTFLNLKKALEGYYVLLLKPEGLPANHPHRKVIEILLKDLPTVDTMQEATSGSKAIHQQQGKQRTRKSGDAPYVAHEHDAAMSAIYDIYPHRNEPGFKINLKVIVTLLAIHDTEEDSDLDSAEIIDHHILRLLNTTDSTIYPFIRSANPDEDVKSFHEENLHLLGEDDIRLLKKGFRIVSDETVLTEEEEEREIIAIEEMDMFTEFPTEYDNGKITNLIKRMKGIAHDDPEAQQLALIAKLEDRANNIKTQRTMSVDYQFKNLRATTNRLLAFSMTEYENRKEYPLYNAISRLLDLTISEYKYLRQNHGPVKPERDQSFAELQNIQQKTEDDKSTISGEDYRFMAQLEKWLIEVDTNYRRPETPEQQRIATQYEINRALLLNPVNSQLPSHDPQPQK